MKKYIGARLHIDSDDRFENDVNLNIKGLIDENGNSCVINNNVNFSDEIKSKYPFLFLPYDENGFVNLNCHIDENNNIVYNDIKLFNIIDYSTHLCETGTEDDLTSNYFGKKYDYYAVYFSKDSKDDKRVIATLDFGNNILITNAWVCFHVYYE